MKEKKKTTMKVNRKTVLAAIALLLATATIGGTLAYLTDNEHVTNTFTVGKVEIEGSEPNWDPDEDGTEGGTAENVVPTQSFAKDPMITNTGDNDAYVYIEVEVPMADVIYANALGERQNGGKAAHIELFEFDATDKTVQTLTDGIGTSEQNDNWTQLYKKEIDGKMVYTFAYNEILTPNAETAPLFDTITLANIVEGQLDNTELNVNVHFYAIQTVNTGGEATDVPGQAKNAYDKYIAQNSGLDGAAVNENK